MMEVNGNAVIVTIGKVVTMLRNRIICNFRVTSHRQRCTLYAKSFFSINEEKNSSKLSLKDRFDTLFGLQSDAADSTSRLIVLGSAVTANICIGAPLAWTSLSDTLVRDIGVVAPAISDWHVMQTTLPGTLAMIIFGASAAIFGRVQEHYSVRAAILLGGSAVSAGLVVSSLGVFSHQPLLLTLGVGLLSGLGMGLAYTPPIQALLQWFPDKKGLASGSVIAGFGSGALLFTPAMQYLMNTFKTLPTYLGPASEVTTQLVDGRLMALLDGGAVEVVEALSKDLAKLPYGQLAEGLYVVGSGSTGAAEALAVMGGVYFAVILGSSLLMRTPPVNYKPPVVAPASTAAATNTAPSTVLGTHHFADVNEAIRTPQFHLLGVTFVCLAAGGLGLFSVAKPMMSELIHLSSTEIAQYSASLLTAGVGEEFFIIMECLTLSGGRLVFGGLSDYLGRYQTILLLTMTSIPMYFLVPTLLHSSTSDATALVAATSAAAALAGGMYSVLPCYVAEQYGLRHSGGIYGMLMLYATMGTLLGPYIVTKCKIISEIKALKNMATMVTPDQFLSTFGVSSADISDLYYKQQISVAKLLPLTDNVTDPTPFLYDKSFYALGGMMVAATVAHSLVVPYIPKSAIEAELQRKEEKFLEEYGDNRRNKRKRRSKKDDTRK